MTILFNFLIVSGLGFFPYVVYKKKKVKSSLIRKDTEIPDESQQCQYANIRLE